MRYIFGFILGGFLYACVPLSTSNTSTSIQNPNLPAKKFTTQNKVYEDSIYTVQFYPEGAPLRPPIMALRRGNLILEFDELSQDFSEFSVKIVHCTRDWKPSLLNEMEFMNDFNEFQIRDRQLSAGTRRQYSHYRFVLPPLKISGNYVLKVFRGNDENDLVLTRRFVLFESLINIAPKVQFSSIISEKRKNQEINLTITYPNFELFQPQNNVFVVMRQNYRWEGAIENLRPRNVIELQRRLEYDYFNLENNFLGINEFRQFDLRSIRYLGLNIANLDLKTEGVLASLNADRARDGKPYVRRRDRNGQFMISDPVGGEYVDVTFKLESRQGYEGEVYIIGGFNDWQVDERNLMTYKPEEMRYTGNYLIKQGEYDYIYALKKRNETGISFSPIEGTYQETENAYDIIVYYRESAGRFDRVIGYKSFTSINAR